MLSEKFIVFMIKWVSQLKLLSTSLDKLKEIFFESVIVRNLLSSICTPIFVVTWINCCKDFLGFYFSLYQLFPPFLCAINIGSLVNSLSGVNIFNRFLSATSFSNVGLFRIWAVFYDLLVVALVILFYNLLMVVKKHHHNHNH